jgi:uncharacterized repeat protein (TIGR01451 family)
VVTGLGASRIRVFALFLCAVASFAPARIGRCFGLVRRFCAALAFAIPISVALTPLVAQPASAQVILSAIKAHVGNATQGQTGFQFTISVTNNGSSPTSAVTNVTDTLPSGMTPISGSGSGWGCVIAAQTVSCTSSTFVAGAGGAFPVLTLSVDVASNAAASLSNTAAVSGGGDLNSHSSNTDTVTVIPAASPPTIAKTFGVASISQGASTSLTITISNPNASTVLTNVAFTDILPAGLVIATPNSLSTTCGGTATAVAGSGSLSLSGGTVASSASCVVSANVTGASAGVKNNSVTATSDQGTSNTANAGITVNAASPPTIAKAFLPSAIVTNGTSSLTFTITNPNASTALTGVAFSDTLPSGLAVANASATVCGGTLTTTAPTGIALSGSTITQGSQCQFSVTVTGTASGNFTNTTGAVTSTNGGTGNTATANLTVSNPATHFSVSAPATATSGTAFNFTITALDASNNVATGYAGTVHFSSSDGQAILPANATLTNGVGTFSSTLKTAGAQTITGIDTVTSSINGTSNAINVSSTAATHFSIAAPSTATSGTAFNFTITALDASNNTATGYTGTVHFSSSDGQAILPANATLTNGVGTFSSTLKTAGAQTITGTDTVTSSITGTSNSINVGGGGATHFTVTAPATATAGTAFIFSVTARDASNNVATGYAGTVHFTKSDSGAGSVVPANSTLTNGVGTFSATLVTAGAQTITATDTATASITGTSNAINVGSATATHFTVSAPATATAGTAFNFTVTALDASNNTATAYTGTVHFTSSDGQAILPADSTLTNGVGTFSSTLKTAGAQTITAKDTVTASITGTSNAINVSSGAATHFTVLAPAAATAGTAFNFTVTALDTSNNVATGYSGAAHFTSSDGAAVLPANSTLSSGVGTFSATLKTDGSQTITATDTVTASITGTSNAINVGHKASSTTLTSSQNPSSGGQPVTFTATVAGSPGTPTGTVTFADGATTLATVAMAGGTASFTTSSLTVGVHTMVATYSGDVGFATSTASLQQAVNVPVDSLKLRQMQIIGTQLAAQSSGQAISGAIDSAINDGFNDNPALTTPSEGGLHLTFTGEPVEKRVLTAAPQDDVRDFANNPFKRQTRVDDAFSALGYAPRYNKAPPPSPTTNGPRVWTGWVDVRGVFWDRNSIGADIRGNQINAIAGVTARITPNFLVGVLGGYEHLDATSQVLTGQLKGGGWTAGTYLGWKFAPHLRLDAGLAGTLLDYQGTAGTAAGTFSGNRWLASGGVTGTYDVARFVVEPSARIYALWEHDSAYTDSLGTLQTARNFSTGRASGGVKIATPIAWTSSAVVTPYAGLYGDYYFSKDDEGAVLVAPIPLVQGWSARVVSGLSVTFDGKAQISIGGELGGLGSDYTIWSVRSRASIPFN